MREVSWCLPSCPTDDTFWSRSSRVCLWDEGRRDESRGVQGEIVSRTVFVRGAQYVSSGAQVFWSHKKTEEARSGSGLRRKLRSPDYQVTQRVSLDPDLRLRRCECHSGTRPGRERLGDGGLGVLSLLGCRQCPTDPSIFHGTHLGGRITYKLFTVHSLEYTPSCVRR